MQLGELTKGREEWQIEQTRVCKYMEGLEQRMYDANKRSLETLKMMRDMELEVSTLKNYIVDLKGKVAIYLPVKSDPIDLKVAEFVNNYPERSKLKIMFMRESVGVYQYGSKRINVKSENNKILIRVGGGYLGIDEFLDQFQPVELSKIEAKDPLKKFSEKLIVAKILQGNKVPPQPSRQFSPMR